MTVEGSLEMGAYLRRDPRGRDDIDVLLARIPMLATKSHDPAGTLSAGQQQLLEMAIALLLHLCLLMLDEPSLGLNPRVVEIIFDTKKTLSVSHHGFVLALGRNRSRHRRRAAERHGGAAAALLGRVVRPPDGAGANRIRTHVSALRGLRRRLR